MVKVIGPNGMTVDLKPAVASGLVRSGRHKYVDEPPVRSVRVELTAEFDAYTEAKQEAATAPSVFASGTPKGNASLEEWQDYAAKNGKDVDGLSRDEIRSLFKE